tara:strand:- start:1817 stop:2062 length:246 start_codon:yes stop_codon:yes gene_type:complete
MTETTLAIAWIKDAIHLMQSSHGENLGTWKTNIVDGTREYPFPANIIKLRSVSILDTNDSKYKRIKRLVRNPVVTEDTDPE